MPVSNMYRIRAELGGLAEGGGVSTFYTDAGAATAQAAADAVNAIYLDVQSIVSNALSWVIDATVDVVDPVTGMIQSQEGISPGSGTGSNTGDPVALSSQALIRWFTGQFVGGRELRGRTFVAGLGSGTLTDDGRLRTSIQSTILTAAENYRLSGVNPAVYSRTHGVWQPISATGVWGSFAVLRSRRD